EVKQRKDLQKIRDTIELQKELINYLEDCCKVLSQFGYSVKNAVELMKLM
ncbi:MAG: recombination mediator protein UvsY, partial [Candidatus Heimdallarchaeaceae archaeon]